MTRFKKDYGEIKNDYSNALEDYLKNKTNRTLDDVYRSYSPAKAEACVKDC